MRRRAASATAIDAAARTDAAARPGQPGDRRDQPPPSAGPRALPPEESRFASLSIRIRPAGGEILIDGERWEGPASTDERLIVQVPEGHHVIEVQREGYERFTTEIDVSRGETTPVTHQLAASLRRPAEAG